MLLNARQVFDEDGTGSALLLAIEDVTERRDTEREKDELLRQKEVLLQEMQHRVANNMQLVASVLQLERTTPRSKTRPATGNGSSSTPLGGRRDQRDRLADHPMPGPMRK